MKQIFGISFTFLFILSSYKGVSQDYNSGITVSMKGYVVNFGGKIFFQPCDDNAKDFWQSLDNRSFSLWYFREDLYLDAIDSVGSFLTVGYFDNDDKKLYTTQLGFFYCYLEVDMMFLDSGSFRIFQKPKHEIIYKEKKYPLEGFAVDNRIQKLIPKDKRNFALMYNYFLKHGYTIPKWLSDYKKKYQSSKWK